MKKIIFTISLCGILLMGATGCGSNTNEIKEEQKEEVKGNCTVTECIKLLSTKNTIEEMNEIIGFEAEKSDYQEKYTWKLDSKNQIDVTYTSGDPMIQATIDKSTIANDDNDFSSYTEMAEALRSGKTYTYKQIVEKVGGVEGTLAGITTSSKRYIWVDKNNRTFAATISDKSGKVSIISLR